MQSFEQTPRAYLEVIERQGSLTPKVLSPLGHHA
jgi:hypothetical protein